MRKKDDILSNCRKDILDEHYKRDRLFWLKVREIEVLIDLRDTLVLLHNDIQGMSKDIRERPSL